MSQHRYPPTTKGDNLAPSPCYSYGKQKPSLESRTPATVITKLTLRLATPPAQQRKELAYEEKNSEKLKKEVIADQMK